MSHLTDAYLAGTAKGAKSDDRAVKNYRASRDCIDAALPDLQLHVLTEELERTNAAVDDTADHEKQDDLIAHASILRARIAELKGEQS